ncbi:transaldolase [Monosporozyma unispora]
MEPKQKKQKKGTNALENLKASGTVVVADTGDFEEIEKYSPQDSTTNPSLILAASKKEQYQSLIDAAVEYGKEKGTSDEEKVCIAMDKLLVEFGTSILKIVPGRVSTEVDARLSFDKEKTIEKALHIIKLYEEEGISKERILIKVGATWEGIQAAKELEEKHGIHCNLTLLFSFVQAVACAEAGITLVSPFIGRILDYFKQKTGKTYSGEDDPGVVAVKKIFYYYKKYGYDTIIMGASFRNVDEIKALAGLDHVTLSLNLLESLANSKDEISKKLDAKEADEMAGDKVSYINDESKFRYDFNEDEVAVVKVADGIRKFAADAITLQEMLEEKIST